GGNGSQGDARAIDHGKIAVPAALWKIIVVLDKPGAGLGSITAKTRVTAVSIPNRQGIKTQRWTTFRTTVRQLEQQTGLDFLANLPQSVQTALENRVDTP
ncbi:MAG: DNA/RNA non-specific endonuclease, partial [Thermosynechococcaceae cyanobacterium]